MRTTKFIIILFMFIAYIPSTTSVYTYFRKPNNQPITYNNVQFYIENLKELDFISNTTLTKGLSNIKKSKVIFVGITRNNAKDLPIFIKQVEELGNLFLDYSGIFYENDSNDGTKEILFSWQHQNHKINIISENLNNKKRPSFQFLANARNRYLDSIINNKKFQNFDYIIIQDIDMKYGFDVRGVLDSFSKENDWDVVCANGISNKAGNMHDAFAFRDDEFPYGPDQIENYWDKIIPQIQRIHSPQESLKPVNSCFGGLAIYKTAFIKNCRYQSINEDCEHISFHQCLKQQNNAKIMFNPTMLIRYSHYS